MPYAIYIALLAFGLIAIALNILSLPGNWLLFLAVLATSWFNQWRAPGLVPLVIIFAVLASGEVVDLLAAVIGTRKFGGSTPAAWLALAGGFAGAIIGVPIPVAGTLVGAILGSFIGALTCELIRNHGKKHPGHSLLAATGAALGRAAGILAKITCGMIVWAFLLVSAFPWYRW